MTAEKSDSRMLNCIKLKLINLTGLNKLSGKKCQGNNTNNSNLSKKLI